MNPTLHIEIQIVDGELRLTRQTENFPFDDLPVTQRLIVNNLTDLYLEGKGLKKDDAKPSDS